MKYKFIGTHTARRTFVTIALQKGMTYQAVRDITGHTDDKMLEIYRQKSVGFLRSQIDDVFGNSLDILNKKVRVQ